MPTSTQTDTLAFGLAHVPRFRHSLGDRYPGVLSLLGVKRHRGGRPNGFAIYLLYIRRQGPYFVALGMAPIGIAEHLKSCYPVEPVT